MYSSREKGEMRQETWNRRRETGDLRQTGDMRQEMWDRWHETGDRRRETRDMRQEEQLVKKL